MRREQLIKARKASGKSQEEIGQEVGVDRTTVGTWERGEYTPQPHQRGAYAEAINLTLTELDALLTTIASADDRTPIWLAQYLGMEQSATEIFGHEPHVIDGLLQTPDYAAAIARSVGVVPTSEAYARRNVEQRAYRQGRVNNGDLVLHVVQPEIALRLQVGTPTVMAEQMDRLIEMGHRPNVTIQIVPFSAGQYEALRMGCISIMTHPWVQGRSVYYLPYHGLALVDDTEEAEHFVAAVEHATTVALSPEDSLAFIAQAGEQWRQTR